MPFGAQFNLREVEGAFESFFVDNSVVLVESSDMIRSEEAKELSSPTRQAIQRCYALRAVGPTARSTTRTCRSVQGRGDSDVAIRIGLR